MSTIKFHFIFILIGMLGIEYSSAQVVNKKVKMVSWSSGSCDETVNPYAIQNRISDIYILRDTLYLSINFQDNCCAVFSPEISFKRDTLFIIPYKRDFLYYCSCDCCFSIDFTFTGLVDTSFVTILKDEKIIYSIEKYATHPIKYTIQDGDTINKTNKYGEPIGLWIEYYENSTNIKSISNS